MRRLILEEPLSRAALWSPRLAGFALAVSAIAVALLRFGRVELLPGVVTLLIGLAIATLAALAALAGLYRIWSEGRRGLGSALLGLILATLLLGVPAFFATRALLLPAITDVTTDVADPPAFSRSRAAIAARGGVPQEPPAAARTEQRRAYPRIASLTLDRSAEEAFDLAVQAAERRGWRILDRSRPGGRRGDGRFDAVDRTLVLRLPEDVTVRVRPIADGSRLDVRSASRIGPHDIGGNARRIQSFLDAVSDLALAEK
jgi:hypothetical protein